MIYQQQKYIVTVAGTGHRPDKTGGYGPRAYDRLQGVIIPWLEENKPECVISGMALGWDQALADCAIWMQIPLIAAIPFKGQERKWPLESQQNYQRILNQATTIKIVCEGEYVSWKMQKRNEWMVDNCDLVLALWDGSPGGTANCIKYADGKKPIVNLYNEWKLK